MIIAAILLIGLTKYVYMVNSISSKMKWVPGPKPLPIIGNGLELKGVTRMFI